MGCFKLWIFSSHFSFDTLRLFDLDRQLYSLHFSRLFYFSGPSALSTFTFRPLYTLHRATSHLTHDTANALRGPSSYLQAHSACPFYTLPTLFIRPCTISPRPLLSSSLSAWTFLSRAIKWHGLSATSSLFLSTDRLEGDSADT